MKLKKLLSFAKRNLIPIVYVFAALLWETLSLVFFDCAPFIKKPFFPLLLLAVCVSLICLLHSKRLRAVLSSFFLLVQIGIVLACNYLFLSNGTIFEWSMFNMRNDAYATMEHIIISHGLIVLGVLMWLAYVTFLIVHVIRCKRAGTLQATNASRKPLLICLALLLPVILLYRPKNHTGNSADQYEAMLYDANNNYQELGITANLAYEVIHRAGGVAVDTEHLDGLDEKIYEERLETSRYHGVSEGNNLIMVLVESFEWYPLTIYDEELTKQIYPNLTKLVSESVTCDNFYAREKTDTSEALMLLGSNPSGKYLHYDFAENTYPYSLPSLFRQQAQTLGWDSVRIRSYHHNTGTFYNRKQLHQSLGFEFLTDINDMAAYGVKNTWNTEQKERNLDSDAMACMKDEMFPTDSPFFTFWITFSSHGFYDERTNFREYYEKFDSLGVFPEGDTYESYLRTYAAAIADLDKAVGIMMNDLEQKELLEDTTILLISDHNTYYSSLSNYVKDIDTRYNSELYRVPCIIYDQKLTKAMDEAGESRSITKFTTTADVIPTVLDLLGIPGWKNLYYGSTVFGNRESVIFSRAYNLLLTDKFMGYSLSDIKYRAEGTTDEDFQDFERRAILHVERMRLLDQIFYSDYFSTHEYQP